MLRSILLLCCVAVTISSCAEEEETFERTLEGDSVQIQAPTLPPDSDTVVAMRRRLYVPVYSHIYHGNDRPPIDLAVTLSVRNTDARNALRLISVRYYDSRGKLLRTFLKNPVRLAAMTATEFLIDEKDDSGDTGANFIVEWAAATRISQPAIQAVMIGTESSQGISFVTEGRVVEEAGIE